LFTWIQFCANIINCVSDYFFQGLLWCVEVCHGKWCQGMRGSFYRNYIKLPFVILFSVMNFSCNCFFMCRLLSVENWGPREPNPWSSRTVIWFLLDNQSRTTLTLLWDMCSLDRLAYHLTTLLVFFCFLHFMSVVHLVCYGFMLLMFVSFVM